VIDHFTLTVTDVTRTRVFYEQALAPLGYSVQMEYEGFIGFGAGGKPSFWIKEGPMPQTPMHIAFVAGDRKRVDAFHTAALAAGGRDDGPPGVRAHYHPSYYGAFVIDPEGHPIEAVCHRPVAAKAKAKKLAKKKATPKKKPKPKSKSKSKSKR
jgi:catechol 2,3-dioxygenase-like lactoylglutathione lyase family enzyme